jgi:hypothetical protein
MQGNKAMAIHTDKIRKLCEEFGFDELTAWRHLRDQEILRRRFEYQDRTRVFGKW